VNQKYRHPNQKSKNYTNIQETIKGKTTNQPKETRAVIPTAHTNSGSGQENRD
jgi:hypothetical protein